MGSGYRDAQNDKKPHAHLRLISEPGMGGGSECREKLASLLLLPPPELELELEFKLGYLNSV